MLLPALYLELLQPETSMQCPHPTLCCDAVVSFPLWALICAFDCKMAETQDVFFKIRSLWVQRHGCKKAGFMLAPCAQGHLLLLMWDLDFGRRTYPCWSFTSDCVLLLIGGVCGLSFLQGKLLARHLSIFLGVENNLKKILEYFKLLKTSEFKKNSVDWYIYIYIFGSSFSQLGSYLCENTYVSPRH